MHSSQFKTLALASVVAGLTACGSGSDAPSTSTTDNNFDYYEVVDETLSTSTVNGVTSQTAKLVLSHQLIRDDVRMWQDTDVITNTASPYLTAMTILTENALVIAKEKALGDYKTDANFNTSFANNNIAIQSKIDPKFTMTYTHVDKDIAGVSINEAADLELLTKIQNLPSTQNNFGSNQSCKAIKSATYTIDYIEFGSTVSNDAKTKADLDTLAASKNYTDKISGNWQGIDWVAFSFEKDEGYGHGYALYDNKIWHIDYQKAGTYIVPDTKLQCTFFTKAQADMITTAARAAYPQ